MKKLIMAVAAIFIATPAMAIDLNDLADGYTFNQAYNAAMDQKHFAKDGTGDNLLKFKYYGDGLKQLKANAGGALKTKGTKFQIESKWYDLSNEEGRKKFLKIITLGNGPKAGEIAKIKSQQYVWSGDTWRNMNDEMFMYGKNYTLNITNFAWYAGYDTITYSEPSWWTKGSLKLKKDGKTFDLVTADSRQLKNVISDAIDTAYKDGFDDGYKNGFVDGYDQGWYDAKSGKAYNNN